MKKIEIHGMGANNQTVLRKLENEFFVNFMNNECKQLLMGLYKHSLPSINTNVSFSFRNENFSYNVPNKLYSKYIEADWNGAFVLSNMDEDVFSLIFLAILSEQSIVFVSENSALLTCTLLVFHGLLKPFKFPHPLIFNVPEHILHILDSPFPILVGINKNKEYVVDNQLAEQHPNCSFILLDNNIEILNYD